MCNYCPNLVAWLDNELTANEAAQANQHLEECVECRARLSSYNEVGVLFESWCEVAGPAVERLAPERRIPEHRAALATAVAAFAIAASFALAFLNVQRPVSGRTVAAPQSRTSAAALPDPPVESDFSVPMQRARASAPRHLIGYPPRPRGTVAGPNPIASGGPTFRIDIPADSMFPPGAVPENFSFVADVTISSDGSTQQLILHPRLNPY